MRFFLSQEERTKKSNEKRLEKVKMQVQERKMGFRANAVSKLNFLYPDMKFLIGVFSDQFAGFSKEKRTLISGVFLDKYLPKIEDLEEHLDAVDFDARANQFSRDIVNLVFRSDLDDPLKREMDENNKRHFLNQCGDRGYTYDDQFLPYDVRLLKNNKLIGRSDVVCAKPNGYFAEKAYEGIVQDTSGSGFSSVTIKLFLWNYGDCTEQEIFFVFQDPSRKSESDFRDNYIKVCLQFTPFLQIVEDFLNDSQWREESIVNGITDRQLGLY